MPTRKELIEALEARGVAVSKRWNKAQMERILAEQPEPVADPVPEAVQPDAPEDGTTAADEPLTVDVGIMRATVDPGDDGALGTEDDEVTIAPIPVEDADPDPGPIPPAAPAPPTPVPAAPVADPPPDPFDQPVVRYRLICGITLNGQPIDRGNLLPEDATPEQIAHLLAQNAIEPV